MSSGMKLSVQNFILFLISLPTPIPLRLRNIKRKGMKPSKTMVPSQVQKALCVISFYRKKLQLPRASAEIEAVAG